ncbi:MAG TPA: DUF1653 domain-containing protein [Candidatus Limnocylindria bacterium]|nr:DUF1653 domain-containing protein [Candidatus Limnocylindria bacterium]
MGEKDPHATLLKRLADANQQMTVGARYMHYKQKPYKVTALAFLEETMELCVVYQAEYGGSTFIRTVANWLEKVEWDGKTMQRFTKIEST